MNFVSLYFIIFLVVLYLLFILCPARFRKHLLLVASYFFYASWSLPFIAIILFSTSTDYWISRKITGCEVPKTRKAWLVTGLAINLLILGFFKYVNFSLGLLHLVATWASIPLDLPESLNVILPLGISFYTFEAISYMVDVYRGHPPARNWLSYNFYIMYFPHLISGPIVRYQELSPQFDAGAIRLPSSQRIERGMELILLGYLFKIIIADPVSTLADPVFQHPKEATVLTTYLAALAFTVQIYFDFLGYTHIARGVSLLFNIELPVNFNHPYLAKNVSDFWHRWHITLSRWIRDYLYIPLGGSRGTYFQTVIALMITMTLAGAWHGAGLPYILWGAYYGVLLSAYHGFKLLKKRFFPTPVASKLLPNWLTNGLAQGYRMSGWLLTFWLVVAGWILFRSPDMATLQTLLGHFLNIPGFCHSLMTLPTSMSLLQLLFLLACCVLGLWVAKGLATLYRPLPFWTKTGVVGICFFLSCILLTKPLKPFIYFIF